MELWTREHAVTLLPALGVMIVLAAILRMTLGNKKWEIRMIPFQVLACIALVLEIGKQIVSVSRGYDLYHLPFHFCSLFIFMLPVMAFYRGKYSNAVRTITSALCTSVFLLMMIYPNLIYSAGNINEFFGEFMSFHTVAFHNIVVFEFVLILVLELHTPQSKGETKPVVVFTVCFCGVAATMAQLLKTNFANFYTCNIPAFETVRIAVQDVLGAVAAQVFYVLVVAVLHILFVFGSYWFYRLLRRLISR